MKILCILRPVLIQEWNLYLHDEIIMALVLFITIIFSRCNIFEDWSRRTFYGDNFRGSRILSATPISVAAQPRRSSSFSVALK